MSQSPRRFQFARTRPLLFSTLAVAALAGTVAAGTYAYSKIFHFEGTATTSDGSTVQFQGEAIVEGDNTDVTVSLDPTTAAANGEGTVTLPDGRQVKVITVPATK